MWWSSRTMKSVQTLLFRANMQKIVAMPCLTLVNTILIACACVNSFQTLIFLSRSGTLHVYVNPRRWNDHSHQSAGIKLIVESWSIYINCQQRAHNVEYDIFRSRFWKILLMQRTSKWNWTRQKRENASNLEVQNWMIGEYRRSKELK